MRDPLAVVLVGGQSTRIRHLLPGLPKPLAPVAGRPFLEWVIRFLRAQGLSRIVISGGYLGEKIAQFAEGLALDKLCLSCIQEPRPLGTAGALHYALGKVGEPADTVLVCNGDSLVLTDLAPLGLALANSAVDAALLGVRVSNAARYGTLLIGADDELLGFQEKRPGDGIVNGGVYHLRPSTIAQFPERTPLSLEYDVFPLLLAAGKKCAVVRCDAPFLDIGTAESLALAETFIHDNRAWFL